MKQNELRQELLATLAAGRELPGDTDEYLVVGLLARLQPAPRRLEELRALYHAVIPVKPFTIVRIAVVQGIVLFVLAELMIDRLWPYFFPNSDGYVLLWEMLAVIWLVEVVVTTGAAAAVYQRTERRTSSHRKPHIGKA